MKILIADDDADDRNLASIAFSEIAGGHDLAFAKNGQELVDLLSEDLKNKIKLPDLILLDLNMPLKDGRVALKEIKTHAKLKHLDVIIFSTSSSEIDKNYTAEWGAKKYLVKPSDFNELLEILKSVTEELVE